MNIQNYIIYALEKGGEFLDGILQNLVGSKHNLSAKFGKESQLISATHDGLSITRTKCLSAKKSKEHNDYWLPWLKENMEKAGLEVTPSAGNFILVKFPAGKKISATGVTWQRDRQTRRPLLPHTFW